MNIELDPRTAGASRQVCFDGLKKAIAIRNKRTSISDKENVEKSRLRQAKELLKLFEEDTGSPATSKEELAAWLFSARGEFAVEKKAKLLQKKDRSKN